MLCLKEHRKQGAIPCLSWFDSNPIVDSPVQALLTSKIFLRCLNGHVAQQKLNLLQLATCNVTQASA